MFRIRCPIIMLIIRRIDMDMVRKINLFNSMMLIAKIIDRLVLLGDIFMNSRFRLFRAEIKIAVVHMINVKFRVNEIFTEFEYMDGARFTRFIIIIMDSVLFHKLFSDLFLVLENSVYGLMLWFFSQNL